MLKYPLRALVLLSLVSGQVYVQSVLAQTHDALVFMMSMCVVSEDGQSLGKPCATVQLVPLHT